MADMVEVTRFKDCKYIRFLKDFKNKKYIYIHCKIMNVFVMDDSFCSYGTPKNGEARE